MAGRLVRSLVPQKVRLRLWQLRWQARDEAVRRRVVRVPLARAVMAIRRFRVRARRRAAEPTGLDRLDAVIFINLARRPDRRAAFEAEVERLGIRGVTRLEAIEHPIAMLGCTLSHIASVGRMLEHGWEAIMVCEDDVRFALDREELDVLVDAFLDDPAADVACLAYKEKVTEPYSSLFLRATYALTTACYVVKASIAPDIVRAWEESLDTRDDEGKAFGTDYVWKGLQETRRFLIPIERAAYQEPGYSDILGRSVPARH
jgi:hypothetical protein